VLLRRQRQRQRQQQQQQAAASKTPAKPRRDGQSISVGSCMVAQIMGLRSVSALALAAITLDSSLRHNLCFGCMVL
jgi:hypothetical protein